MPIHFEIYSDERKFSAISTFRLVILAPQLWLILVILT